jgi:hypothetical protein
VNAYLEFQKGGRVDITTNEVINAKNDWIGEEADFSVMGKFLNEYEITNNETDFITSSNLQYYIEELKEGVSFKKFSVELKKYCLLHSFLLVSSKKKKIGGKSINIWCGIRIRVDEEEEPETTRTITLQPTQPTILTIASKPTHATFLQENKEEDDDEDICIFSCDDLNNGLDDGISV